MFLFNLVPICVRYILFVSLIVLLVAMFSKWSGSPKKSSAMLPKDAIRKIIDTANEYTNTGKKEKDPIVELMHSSYALASLKSARRLMTSKRLQRLTKCMDIDEWSRKLRGSQQRCIGMIQSKTNAKTVSKKTTNNKKTTQGRRKIVTSSYHK